MSPDPTPRPLDYLTCFGEPHAPALLTREGVLTYAELEQAVGRLAGGLLAQGLSAGDRVASWLPKTRMTSLLPLACARAGLVHVPVNPLLKSPQVAHILQDSGARLLVTADVRLSSLEPTAVPSGCRVIADTAHNSLLQNENILPPSDQDPAALAALLYTSGSTGRPKGVMLSHANMWLGAISVAHYTQLGHQDRILAVLPFAFDYGQNQLLSAWAAGACVVPLDYLTSRDVVRQVEQQGITTLAGVPPLWVQLIETAWPPAASLSLKRLTNSGGKLPPSVIRRMREVFPAADIYSMYGLTEAFRSTYLPPELLESRIESIGSEIPFAEVLAVRPDGTPTEDGEEGELVHAGPLVAQGYWNDPERTAQRFKPAPAHSRYGGTAVWSGDRVKRDGQGLFYFVGRHDGMIKTSGNRVSPTEVEEAAVATGVVIEAVALGVPDARLGEAIALVVRPDVREREPELRDALKRRLPNFMQPGAIVWRTDLPRSPNGKLDRVALKQELLG